MLPGPRGRMDSACEDRQSYDGPRRKISPEPKSDLQTGIVSGVFWSTGVLLRQPDVFSFQSKCERIGFDCPWPEM
jgi:hypothetical protein